MVTLWFRDERLNEIKLKRIKVGKSNSRWLAPEAVVVVARGIQITRVLVAHTHLEFEKKVFTCVSSSFWQGLSRE